MIGGALRIVSAFVPYQTPPPLALELFYLVIDVNLLCGLVGIYAWVHRSAGATGFAGFLLAFLGTALIVGPDGKLGALDV